MGKLREFFGGGVVEDTGAGGGAQAPASDLSAFQARAASTRPAGKAARLAAAADAADLDAIFTPDACADIAGLYHDARAAQTGSAVFVLSEANRALLGKPLSIFLKRKMPVDPAWAALAVFVSVWGKMIVQSELAYKREVAAARPKVARLAEGNGAGVRP